MPEPEHVWAVLPTYNEADNLESLVGEVLGQVPEGSRLLVVDDNSPDGTGEIADRLASERNEVSVLHREHKEGLGPAYIAGFRKALDGGAELVLTMDSDFSHDPAHIPDLLGAARGADVVIGSRYVPGGDITEWGPIRRFISRGGSAYARAALGVGVRDLTGGFKVYRRGVLQAIDIDTISSRGYAFQVETTYRAIKAGFRVVEVPIVFSDRRGGTSKMSRAIVAEAIWRVPAMRVQRKFSQRELSTGGKSG